MAFDYTKLRKKADTLIEKFGQSVTFTRKVDGGRYDPQTGDADVIESEFTAKIVVLPTGEGKVEAFDNMREPELVDDRRRYLLVSVEGLTNLPQPTDQVVFEGLTWNVTGVTPLAPSGVNVLATAGVKRV